MKNNIPYPNAIINSGLINGKHKDLYCFLFDNVNPEGYISCNDQDLSIIFGCDETNISDYLKFLNDAGAIKYFDKILQKQIFLNVPLETLKGDYELNEDGLENLAALKKTMLYFSIISICKDLRDYLEFNRYLDDINFLLISDVAAEGIKLVNDWINYKTTPEPMALIITINSINEKLYSHDQVSLNEVIQQKFEFLHSLLGNPYINLIQEVRRKQSNIITVYGRGGGIKKYKVSPKQLKAIQALLDDDGTDDIEF